MKHYRLIIDIPKVYTVDDITKDLKTLTRIFYSLPAFQPGEDRVMGETKDLPYVHGRIEYEDNDTEEYICTQITDCYYTTVYNNKSYSNITLEKPVIKWAKSRETIESFFDNFDSAYIDEDEDEQETN